VVWHNKSNFDKGVMKKEQNIAICSLHKCKEFNNGKKRREGEKIIRNVIQIPKLLTHLIES
jgi:hypothetical protein